MIEQIIINQDKIRLDQVVYQYYGDLSMFDAVLAVNQHIEAVQLKSGDCVRLPLKTQAKTEDTLW